MSVHHCKVCKVEIGRSEGPAPWSEDDAYCSIHHPNPKHRIEATSIPGRTVVVALAPGQSLTQAASSTAGEEVGASQASKGSKKGH